METPHMTRNSRIPALSGVVLLLAIPHRATAQDFAAVITSLDPPTARLASRTTENADVDLGYNDSTVDSQFVRVASGVRASIFMSQPDGILNIIGPAEFRMRQESNGAQLRLLSGAYELVAARPNAGAALVLMAGPENATTVITFNKRGSIYVVVNGGKVSVGYEGDPGSAVDATFSGAAPLKIPSGQAADSTSPGSAAAALNALVSGAGLTAFSTDSQLAVSYVNYKRADLNADVLRSIAEWERATTISIAKRLAQENAKRAEIRQNTVSVSTPQNPTLGTNSAFSSPPVPGANSVPIVSPAGSSLAGGVSAVVDNNSRAQEGLSRNASRGLGSNGLSRLTSQPVIGPRGAFRLRR